MVQRETVPAQPSKVRVTFSLPSSIWAESVRIAGDFDGQTSASIPLRRDEAGWSISMLLERDRAYSYCYLVDHECVVDWNVDGYLIDQDGGRRSIVIARPPLPTPM